MKRIRVVKALGGRELREVFVGNKREIISLRKNLKEKLKFSEKLFTSHKGDRIIQETKPDELLGIVIDKESVAFKNNFKILNRIDCLEFCERLGFDPWTVIKLSGESKIPRWEQLKRRREGKL